jgi:hypothetical protein
LDGLGDLEGIAAARSLALALHCGGGNAHLRLRLPVDTPVLERTGIDARGAAAGFKGAIHLLRPGVALGHQLGLCTQADSGPPVELARRGRLGAESFRRFRVNGPCGDERMTVGLFPAILSGEFRKFVALW